MIIAIASTFHPYRGGIAAFNDRLALSLKDAGHNVHCLNWSRQYPSLLFPGETQTISGHKRPKGSEAPLDSINPRSWRSTAKRILEKGDIEILILPFWHASLAPALRSVAKRVKKLSPNTRVVALMHNASSHDGSSVDKWLTKRFLIQVDSAITLSDSVKNDVIKLRSDLDCRVLFHPLYDHYKPALEKNEARAKLGISSEVDLGLFFGLIRPYKGLDVLVESMSNTSNHLLIAGEAYENWGNYSKMIDKLSFSRSRGGFSKFFTETTKNWGPILFPLGGFHKKRSNAMCVSVRPRCPSGQKTDPISAHVTGRDEANLEFRLTQSIKQLLRKTSLHCMFTSVLDEFWSSYVCRSF